MKIESCSFEGWPEAWKLTRGEMELVVVGSIGPRVVSLRYRGGPNILWNDPKTLGRTEPLEELSFYGGHRLWITPEVDVTCYARDELACAGLVEDGALTVTKPVEPETGLVKSLRFVDGGDDGIDVIHAVGNPTGFEVDTSLWALTCVLPSAAVFFPWGDRSAWDLKTLVFWESWAGHGTDTRSPQWAPGRHVYAVRPTGEEGKVGARGERGWIARAGDGFTFVKEYAHATGGRYPDTGCSVEVYTCADFVEMETLSPTLPIKPGEERTHVERWRCLDGEVDPADEDAVLAQLG